MNIILPVFYTLIFGFIIYKFRFFSPEGINKKTILFLFTLKICAGIVLSLLYMYYFPDPGKADTLVFFKDGKILYSALKESPADYFRMLTGFGSESTNLYHYYDQMDYWHKLFNYNLYNDNKILIRFNAFVCLFSFGHYFVHIVFMAFLSLTGLVAIYRTFIEYVSDKKNLLIIAVFLIPSVVFWTSGLLKEGILIFAFGLFLYCFHEIFFKQFTWKKLTLMIFSFVLLAFIKFYVLAAALPALASWLWSAKTGNKKTAIKFLAVHTLFAIFVIFSGTIIKNYDFLKIISLKQLDFIKHVQTIGNVGSYIQISQLDGTIFSFISATPGAFVNSFFRPHILEAKTIMMLISAIENIFIISCILVAVFYSSLPKGNAKLSNKAVWFFCISYTLMLFLLCGYTTPVLGALVRYRVPAMPFLFIALILIIDLKKIQKSRWYSQLKKIKNLFTSWGISH